MFYSLLLYKCKKQSCLTVSTLIKISIFLMPKWPRFGSGARMTKLLSPVLLSPDKKGPETVWDGKPWIQISFALLIFYSAFPREEIRRPKAFPLFPVLLLFRLPFYYLRLGHDQGWSKYDWIYNILQSAISILYWSGLKDCIEDWNVVQWLQPWLHCSWERKPHSASHCTLRFFA